MVETGAEIWRARVMPDVVAERESRELIGVPYTITSRLNDALRVVQGVRGLRPNACFLSRQEEDSIRVTAIGEVHNDIVELLDTGTLASDPVVENQRADDIDYLRGIRV